MKQMFEEQIEPELLKMKQELRLEQNRQVRRLAGGLSSLAASVGFGAVGMVPAALAAGTVGAALLKDAATSICQHGPNLKEKNDFYFLLRLTQEIAL